MNKVILKKPDGRDLFLYSTRPIPPGIQATSPEKAPLLGHPHMRWHPLREEWVIYAAHRQNRTFLPPKDYSPLLVTTNPQFPTEMPAGDYEAAVFENLFPSLNVQSTECPNLEVPTRPAFGRCEVVVFTQDPDTSLGHLTLSRIKLIVDIWAERTDQLLKVKGIEYVLPFENRGVEMGVTLHHPHGQIYAYPFIPPVQQVAFRAMQDHFSKKKKTLLESILESELKHKSRIITETKHHLTFIPVFARYPYETWIVPKRKVGFLFEMTEDEKKDLAVTLKTTLMKFDGLWERPFPYLLTINQGIKNGNEFNHLYFQFYPPYRTKDKLKYLAGTELGAGIFVNDSLPEDKAKELAEVKVKVDTNE
jgi:UDPglucose--hexose-1-phosphate uridylyltransferase